MFVSKCVRVLWLIEKKRKKKTREGSEHFPVFHMLPRGGDFSSFSPTLMVPFNPGCGLLLFQYLISLLTITLLGDVAVHAVRPLTVNTSRGKNEPGKWYDPCVQRFPSIHVAKGEIFLSFKPTCCQDGYDFNYKLIFAVVFPRKIHLFHLPVSRRGRKIVDYLFQQDSEGCLFVEATWRESFDLFRKVTHSSESSASG